MSTFAVALVAFTLPAMAWDYEGHRAVNELALAALPPNFPAFALTPEARGRIAYLAGEADRWRNETNFKLGTGLSLGNASGPDHYFTMEDLSRYGLSPETLPPLRYDFAAAIAAARATHPDTFPPISAARDSDHTRELCGFLPWAITENYEKLQSDFSTLAALEKFGGTPAEIANAKADIIYVMGVMGHFVGDASQPLHTTKYFNGWVGANPQHYTFSRRFHSWIDGGFFKATGGIEVKKLVGKIHPAESLAAASDPNGIFKTSVDFIAANNRLVEPLYALEKAGKLPEQGEGGPEGRAFLDGQLVKSGQLLGELWVTAWQTAPKDTFLEHELQMRTSASSR